MCPVEDVDGHCDHHQHGEHPGQAPGRARKPDALQVLLRALEREAGEEPSIEEEIDREA
ncbi:hypothetical protein D3C83_239820 [compost metagenome]